MDANLMEGARNLVRYSKVEKGKSVLLLVTKNADYPDVVQAIEEAIREKDAQLVTMKVDGWLRALGEPPQALVAALPVVDIVIQQGTSMNAQARYSQQAMYEYGTSFFVNMSKTAEGLSSDFGRYPLELLYAIGDKVLKRTQKAKRLRLTTKAGTDISMNIHPRHMGGYFYDPNKAGPGSSKAFPGGEFGVYPEDPCDGVVAIEAFQPNVKPPLSILPKPLMMTVKDHWAVEFEGPCADGMQERLRTHGDKYAKLFCEVMWGVHPRSGIKDCRAASNPNMLHCAVGNFQYAGGKYYSKMQLPLYMWQPTITLDGEPLLLDGKLLLLEDKDLRDLASRYGDPDQLLAVRDVPKEDSAFG